jgi:hypothetical protein
LLDKKVIGRENSAKNLNISISTSVGQIFESKTIKSIFICGENSSKYQLIKASSFALCSCPSLANQ